MLGPLERYMTLTIDAALLISSRVGADLGQTSDRLESEAFFRREEEVGADENPSLQLRDEFVRGVTHILSDKADI